MTDAEYEEATLMAAQMMAVVDLRASDAVKMAALAMILAGACVSISGGSRREALLLFKSVNNLTRLHIDGMLEVAPHIHGGTDTAQ